MTPLHRGRPFPFRFAEGRIVRRFPLDDVGERAVAVSRLDPPVGAGFAAVSFEPVA